VQYIIISLILNLLEISLNENYYSKLLPCNLISYHQIIKLIFYERNENIVLAEDKFLSLLLKLRLKEGYKLHVASDGRKQLNW
jgi:hypothetical protein